MKIANQQKRANFSPILQALQKPVPGDLELEIRSSKMKEKVRKNIKISFLRCCQKMSTRYLHLVIQLYLFTIHFFSQTLQS